MARAKSTAAAPEDAAPASQPAKVTLESDFVFWTMHNGAALTRQFYAGQVVRDPDVIAALIDNNAPLKD